MSLIILEITVIAPGRVPFRGVPKLLLLRRELGCEIEERRTLLLLLRRHGVLTVHGGQLGVFSVEWKAGKITHCCGVGGALIGWMMTDG